MATDNERKVTERESEVTMRRTTAEPVTREEMRALLGREPESYTGTWRPTTGGLLAIITGGINALAGIGMIVGSTFFAGVSDFFQAFTLPAGIALGSVLLVLGIISIIGGAFALQRRMWGFALAGAITALVPTPSVILGILSLIFVVLGRREFREGYRR